VSGHKKAPGVITGRFPKMEQAKRLEFIEAGLELLEFERTCLKELLLDAPNDAPEGIL
jgi:hypothetical protein